MREPNESSQSTQNQLELQAFLYAHGELDNHEAAAFENRLGDEQAARDALCQAVHLSTTLGRLSSDQPDPRYKVRVQQLLIPSGASTRWVERLLVYRHHPALWSLLGAAAAVLLMWWLGRPPIGILPKQAYDSLVAQTTRGIDWPDDDDEDTTPSVELASYWADLPNGEHLLKARDEEMRRRVRAEDFQRLATPHERRSRVLGHSPSQR